MITLLKQYRICHGLRRPNNMRYSDYMEECGQCLAQTGDATDRLIPYYIQLQRLSEDVNDTFNYSSTTRSTPTDANHTSILAKTFEQQLSHIESSCKSGHFVAL